MAEEKNKSIKEVVKNGLCLGCGTCESICPKFAIKMARNSSKGIFLPEINSEKCNRCGVCLGVCPGLSVNFKELSSEIFGDESRDTLIGNYIDCYMGHATDFRIRYNSTSGGIATAILIFALEKKIIDGALVTRMKKNNPLEPESFIARTKNEIIEAAKSKYCPVAANTALRDIINSKKEERFAVVGLPCHIQGMRKAEQAIEGLKEKIVLHLGLFCGFSSNFLATEHLLSRAHIKKDRVDSISYRGEGWPGKTSIFLKDGNTKLISYNKDRVRRGFLFCPIRCTLCSDYSAELADISLGDAWLPELENDKIGTSLVIIRGKGGDDLIRKTIINNQVGLVKINKERVLQAQGSLLFLKKKGLGARLSLFKLFNKRVPIYNSELLKPTFYFYFQAIILYLMIFIFSKPYLWRVREVILIIRERINIFRPRNKSIFKNF